MAEDLSTVLDREANSVNATSTNALPTEPSGSVLISPVPLPVAEQRPISGRRYVSPSVGKIPAVPYCCLFGTSCAQEAWVSDLPGVMGSYKGALFNFDWQYQPQKNKEDLSQRQNGTTQVTQEQVGS